MMITRSNMFVPLHLLMISSLAENSLQRSKGAELEADGSSPNLLPNGVQLKALPNPSKYRITPEDIRAHSDLNGADETEGNELIKAVNFMRKFGYVPTGDGTADYIFQKEVIAEKLKLVQKFGALPQTGQLDRATVRLMNSPRCGVRDMDSETFRRRRKRYIIGGDGWNKRKLTYYVANWSPQLFSKENVQSELRKAFDAWTKYSHLQFTEINSNDADIVIFFATYGHGDGYAFDGQGGILAHAYYPYEFGHYGGDIHFDESETWTIAPKDEYSGLDFFTVAVHEIGHSLGLSHSPVQQSIMFPYYKGYKGDSFSLDYDDVMGMWDLYIRRKLDGDDEYFNTTTTTSTTTPTPPTSASPAYDGTQNDGVPNDDDDNVRYHGDYETVDEHEERQKGGNSPDLPALPPLFPEEEESIYEKDRRRREEEERRREEERKRKREEEEEERRWQEERRRHEEEIRRIEEEQRRKWLEEEERINREWHKKYNTTTTSTTTPKSVPLLPDICEEGVDSAAYIREELFLFKGKYLWRFERPGKITPGYPASISSVFSDLPHWINKIDAVYERKNDSKVIFFVGKYYYVHDGVSLTNVSRPITDYRVSDRITQIDASFFWPKNNKTYIFSRNLYWRRDDFSNSLDDNYPRDIERWNGLPNYLDAALTDNRGISYFLKGKYIYQYDNIRIQPNTPMSLRQWIPNC